MNAELKFPPPADVPWMDEQEAKDRAKAVRKAAHDRAFDKWYGEGMAKAALAEVNAATAAGWYHNRGEGMGQATRARQATAARQQRNALLRAAIRAQLAKGWQTHFEVAAALPADVRTSDKTVADNIRIMLPEGGIERRRAGWNDPYQYRAAESNA